MLKLNSITNDMNTSEILTAGLDINWKRDHFLIQKMGKQVIEQKDEGWVIITTKMNYGRVNLQLEIIFNISNPYYKNVHKVIHAKFMNVSI